MLWTLTLSNYIEAWRFYQTEEESYMSNYTKPGLSKKVTLIFNVSEDGKIALSTNEGDMPNAKRLD
jgi:hypothetical protein